MDKDAMLLRDLFDVLQDESEDGMSPELRRFATGLFFQVLRRWVPADLTLEALADG
jgi:hypothetical protein